MALLLGSALAVGLGCDSDDDDCSEGHEGCFCADDYRCLEDLVCLSNRCVESESPSGGSSASDDDDDGGDPTDNVAACEALADSWECQAPGGADLLMCDLYAETTCDVSDYFNCLADNTSCDGDVLDASGWTECAELAECA